jgi:poly(3-hydroxybutyrate) depolymerase
MIISKPCSARARPVLLATVAALLMQLAGCAGEAPAPALPALSIDPARVAVAGLSSGAYMATQAHLALGERIHGAALIAGGPYGCAGGELGQALGPCMKAQPYPPDVDVLAQRARDRAASGLLAPLSSLAGDKVLVLHGRADRVVDPALASATAALYRALGTDGDVAPVQVTLDDARDFGHTFPTSDIGSACLETVTPFLGNCGFDAAGAVFEALFGAEASVGTSQAMMDNGFPDDVTSSAGSHAPATAIAAPPATADAPGELRRFDQWPQWPDGSDPQLADEGYLYVPASCAAGERCGLLTVFHGCEQNVESVGERFVRDAGFNRWADRHSVVVLYPQTRASFVPLNPKGCWDWWGFTGADYDTRRGAQIRWLDAALTALGLPAG